MDTGAGLAGSSQRADLQGVLAASQQPIKQEGGGVWQDGHISHERLGVAVVEGEVVAVPLPAGLLPGGVQRGRAPAAAQAQVADGRGTCIGRGMDGFGWLSRHQLVQELVGQTYPPSCLKPSDRCCLKPN